MSDGPAKERRVSDRVEEILTGWWRTEGEKFQRCKTLDLGMDGALIVLDEVLEDDSSFELHLDMEAEWSVSLSAKILWQRPIFDGKQQLSAVTYKFQKPGDQSMFGLWLRRKIHGESGDTAGKHTAPVKLTKQKPEAKPVLAPAPRVQLLESPWKKRLGQLTARIPWMESEALPNERRKEARGQVGLSVRCETEREIIPAEFLNVSLSGICIFVALDDEKTGVFSQEGKFELKNGEKVDIINSDKSLLMGGRRCHCKVVWTQMAEGFDQTKGMVVGLRVQSEPQATRKTFVGDLLKRINYQVRQVRSELRFPRELPVEVEVHGAGRALGRTLDISAGGAKLELPDSFQTPCNATVTLDMSNGKAGGRRLTLSSRLLRSTVDNEGRNCYAVAFRKGQPRELLELSRWLAGQMRVQNLDELIPNFSSAEGLQ